jgi:hypothetical protein
MSMSEPFLPRLPEDEADRALDEIEDVEEDDQPDVLTGPPDDETGPTERDAGAFRPPRVGERLTPEQLEAELD